MYISNCAQNIQPSATLAISAKAKTMRLDGIDVINFSAGEPDFNTPDFIVDAAIKAAKSGETKYTPVAGTIQLRESIAQRVHADLKLSYNPDEIIVSSGAKQSIAIAIQAMINPGDEVLIPAPYWLSYPDMVRIVGGVPKIITTDATFKLTPEILEKNISKKNKLIILNSPNNPSGMYYNKSELESIAKVLLKYPNIQIISDDIYEKIYWQTESFNNIITVCPELKDRCLIVNGTSKSYAMTGWRIGYAAGNAKLIKAITKLQSHVSGCPCSISQAAATAAFNSDQSFLQESIKQFEKKAKITYASINTISGLKANLTQGAFYSLINAEELIKQKSLSDDFDLAEKLLNDSHIAIVPGSVFGAKNHIRISFALSEEGLVTGLERIKSFAK